jgi:signal transduction histidine kinase
MPSVVMLQVEDDGCGFDVHAQAQRPAWGLLGMEERATLLGGYVAIQSQPNGQGTRVEMMIPYHTQPEVGNGDTTAARG